MATLQKIRSKGPLLIIVIGLALFAFIAGDAFKLTPQGSQDAGEVNGTVLTTQGYQSMVDEYSEVIKFSNNLSSLTEEQMNQIKDEVWMRYLNNQLIMTEAEKIGLSVSDAEVQAIIDAGTHPILRNTPFQTQTGAFDKDILKKFLLDYSKLSANDISSRQYEYFTSMHNFWLYIERTLRQNRLAEKYQALLSRAMSSNPVEAQATFDARSAQMDLVLAAVPYNSVPDSAVKVKNSEVKALYDKRKEQYRQYAETRDIKYIDVQVMPSDEDRANIENEVEEYSSQLGEATSDYSSLIRAASSDYPYVDLFYTKEAYPADVVARIDSVAVGEIFGPYYNSSDNSINAFKKIAKKVDADSIQFRQIQVYDANISRTRELADSIYNALKGGADFAELAIMYGQNPEPVWITSANYENQTFDSDNLKYISTITSLGKNEMVNVSVGMASVILQVVDKRVMKDMYKLAVIKRPIVFSPETYNNAYNDFSRFIAGNRTPEELEASAEDAGYRLRDKEALSSSEHVIAGIKGTKEALRWAFKAKPGEVSGLYEAGDNDRLLVVILSGITKEGYRSLEKVQSELYREVVKEKKAGIIMAEMNALNATSIEQFKSMDDAVVDTVKHVTFSAPAYISALRSNEPVVGAYASTATLNELSKPIKGNNGVIVMKVYSKENTEEVYSQDTETEMLVNTHERMLNRFINELYLKGKVKDNRYLFF